MNLIRKLTKTLTDKWFFTFLFLYQVLFIFQGIDFSDEGFYGAFYQQIFKAPQSVEYNFMYWFSGIIGGAYLSMFHEYGLLALRLGGVFMLMASMLVVYHGLKKYANPYYLKLGLLIATVLISYDPKDLNYDNLSSLFFVSASLLLFQGLFKGQPFKLFIGGCIIALSMFTRIPNILGLSLAVVILYYGWLHHTKFAQLIKLGLIFFSGFISATILILLIMKAMGHLGIFEDCLQLVREMGKSKENTHGIKRMMTLFRYEYSFTLIRGLLYLMIMVGVGAWINRFKENPRNLAIVKLIGFCMLTGCLIFAMKSLMISWYMLLSLVTGLALLAAFITNIDKTKSPEIKVLTVLGALMILVQPLGSDFGLYSMGRYSLWLALPLATNYYFSLQVLSKESISNSFIGKYLSSKTGAPTVYKPSLVLVRNWTVLVLVVLFLYYAMVGTWFGSRNRLEMRYTINNPYVKGVLTTQKKAADINELLQESSKYVKKDDYVLAYDLIPLYYPMTETRPYVRNSWPKLYDRHVFKTELEKAITEHKGLPVIIYQKVNTMGSPEWPDLSSRDWDINQPRNATIKSFMEDNHYRMVWENTSFQIFIPG